MRSPTRHTGSPSMTHFVLASLCATSLLVVSLLSYRYDSYTRQNELAGLLSGIERAEYVMAVWSEKMNAQLGTCLQEATCDRDKLARSLESEASRAEQALYQHETAIRTTWVSPWHASVQEIKATYLIHLEVWLLYFDEISRDGGAVSSSIHITEIGSSFVDACAALRAVAGSTLYPNRASSNRTRSLAVCAKP